MNTSARELVDWIRKSIYSLSITPEYGSKESVYRDLAESSGLSKSLIIKLDSGETDNPKADTIDALSAAIKTIYKRLAA